MNAVSMAALFPHPPILVPEVGGRELDRVTKTITGIQELAAAVVAAQPQVVIMISPHGPFLDDAIPLWDMAELTGDLGQFGAPQVRFQQSGDRRLVAAILRQLEQARIPAVSLSAREARSYGLAAQLDHGMMVPLCFLKQAGLQSSMVALGMGLLGPEQLYRAGMVLAETASELGLRAVVIASGDLSHRLTPDAPAGYHPDGKRFDALVQAALIAGDSMALVRLAPGLAENAGECGWRPLLMALGSLDGVQVKTRVYSYEAPFGVGYLAAAWQAGEPAVERCFLAGLVEQRNQQMRQQRARESAPVRLARMALEHYVRHDSLPEAPPDLAQDLEGQRAGVFVSLKKHGRLRGCIGTVAPVYSNLIEEIMTNAVQAGLADPRFDPVEDEELGDISYSVDVIQPAEPVGGLEQLDPKHYGVIVRSRGKTGLLLPDLEGIDSAEQQVEIARQKAGIASGDRYQLERFEVIRYH